MARHARWLSAFMSAALLLPVSGCTWFSYLGTDYTGEHLGRTYYLGGAGPLGHVGTIDVPNGLRRGGYRGAIIVFGWQSWVPSTLIDQMDRDRNEGQAERLASDIVEYLEQYPGRRINIIALSASTGIATWALERLPEDVRIGTVIFLGSSLSRTYPLGDALRHLDGRLYNFYSPSDPVLRFGVPLTGTVDREFRGPAGMYGFTRPPAAEIEHVELYETRLRNMAWRREYARHGWSGRHTDTTSEEFVRKLLAPFVMEPLRPAVRSTTQPATHPPPASAPRKEAS